MGYQLFSASDHATLNQKPMLAHEEFRGFRVAKRVALINLTVDVTVQSRNSWIIGNARGCLSGKPM